MEPITLEEATKRGDIVTVKVKLDLGETQEDIDNALSFAALFGNMQMFKLILKYGGNIHAASEESLRCACYGGHLEMIEYLIKLGADINKTNEPLWYARYKGNTEAINLLLKYGAKPI